MPSGWMTCSAGAVVMTAPCFCRALSTSRRTPPITFFDPDSTCDLLLSGEQLRLASSFAIRIQPALVWLRGITVFVVGPILPARQVNLERAKPVRRAEFTGRGHIAHRVTAAPHGAGVRFRSVDQLRVMDRAVIRLQNARHRLAFVERLLLDL